LIKFLAFGAHQCCLGKGREHGKKKRKKEKFKMFGDVRPAVGKAGYHLKGGGELVSKFFVGS